MTIHSPFPDWEALAAQQLRDHIGGGVFSSVPKDPDYPLITVQRVGGTPVERHWVDRATIQIDVWGENKGQARDLADQARVALHNMEGVTYAREFGNVDDAFVNGVEDTLGLTWSPDPPTGRDRYIFGVDIYGHPMPATVP